MFDEVIIKGIHKIVNARMHKNFPMLDEPVKEWMVEEVLKAAFDLMTLFEREKKCSSMKQPTKSK